MSALTQHIEQVCQKLVESHVAHEATLFPIVWDSFWESQRARSLSELTDQVLIADSARTISGVGAIGGEAALETLQIVGGIVETARQLGRLDRRPEAREVREALENALVGNNTPNHLREILTTHGIPLLEALFASETAPEPQPRTSGAWVEYNDDRVTTKHCSDAELDTLQERQAEFRLYVNELAPVTIQIDQQERYRILEPQHQALLFLFLESLRDQSPLTYERIADEVLDRTGMVDQDTKKRVHNLKHELNTHLNGLLNDSLRPKRGSNCYLVTQRPTYCWIRPRQAQSLLSPSS